MWPVQACHRSFFFKIEETEKIKVKKNEDQKANRNITSLFVRKYHLKSGSTVGSICCFATFLARADPRGSCTIP